jgi:hypothetical protein
MCGGEAGEHAVKPYFPHIPIARRVRENWGVTRLQSTGVTHIVMSVENRAAGPRDEIIKT